MSPVQKNKYRLYISFDHRYKLPGYHWALTLAPKKESIDPDIHDCIIFHVTNAAMDGYPPLFWRYERKVVNGLHSQSALVGRALLLKFPADLSLEKLADRVEMIVTAVPIVQGDRQWNCITWVKRAIDALRNGGEPFISIPYIDPELQEELNVFAEEAKEKLLSRAKKLTDLSQLSYKDIRLESVT